MKFYRMLRYDMSNGYHKSIREFSILFMIVILICATFYIHIYNNYHLQEYIPMGTAADYLLYILKGVGKHNASITTGFKIPIEWLLVHLFVLHGVLSYPNRDLTTLGTVVLPRCQSRGVWWVSKCIWNISHIVVSYITVYFAVLVFTLLSGGKIL